MWPALLAGGALSALGSYLGKGKQVYDPYGTLNPEQKAIVQKLGPNLNTWANADPSAYNYTGDFTAPLTAPEQQTQEQVSRLGALAEGGFGKLMSGWSPEWEQIYQDSIANPAKKEWQTETQPALEESYAGPGGYWGTARAGAVQAGQENLNSDLLAKRASLMKDVNFAPIQAGPAMANTFQGIAGIQSIPRAITQYGLDQKYKDYIASYDRQQTYINDALAFLGIKTGTVTTKPTGGVWPYLLSGAGSALSMYGALGGGGSSGYNPDTNLADYWNSIQP